MLYKFEDIWLNKGTMKTIVLLTDFGLKDNFAGTMKGVILNINDKANVVDLSHDVEHQDVFGAAFLLMSSYRYFPKGTIFLVVVDPGVGTKRNALIVKTRNYLFVGPDNGILSLAVLEDGLRKAVKISNKKYMLKDISDTFHGRDIFAPASAYLSKGIPLASFGRPLKEIKRLHVRQPKASGNILRGEVIYIDRFGNLITNLDKKQFFLFTGNKKFEIQIREKKIVSLSNAYQEAGQGEVLAIFGSSGYLEIAVNGHSARKYFTADRGEGVTVAII